MQICHGPFGLSEISRSMLKSKKKSVSSMSVGVVHARRSDKSDTGGGVVIEHSLSY